MKTQRSDGACFLYSVKREPNSVVSGTERSSWFFGTMSRQVAYCTSCSRQPVRRKNRYFRYSSAVIAANNLASSSALYAFVRVRWTLGSLINFDDRSTPFALSSEKTNPMRVAIVLLL